MLNDRIMTGVLIGIFANIIKLISNYIMYLFGMTDVVFWQIAATRFLERKDLMKPIAYFIGAVADTTVTSILGVIFVLIVTISGKDYIWIKGIGFTMSAWVAIFGTLLSQEIQSKIPQKPISIIVTIIAHIIYGIAFAFFTSILYHEENFKNKTT